MQRIRTWDIASADKRSRTQNMVPSSVSINQLTFSPTSQSFDNTQFGLGVQYLTSPFTISGNTSPIQLRWKNASATNLTGTGITVYFKKNSEAATAIAALSTFASTLSSGDTFQVGIGYTSTTDVSFSLGLQNVTDGAVGCSNTLTITVTAPSGGGV
jgi:hypothetical protein